MRTMTSARRLATFGAIAVLGLSAAACEQVGAAVDNATAAAGNAVDRVEFCAAALQAVQAANDRDLDGAISAGQRMVDNAPDDVRADAEFILREVTAAKESGDLSRLDSQEFRDTAQRLQTNARDNCDPR